MEAREFVTRELGVMETIPSDKDLKIESLTVGYSQFGACVGYRISNKFSSNYE